MLFKNFASLLNTMRVLSRRIRKLWVAFSNLIPLMFFSKVRVKTCWLIPLLRWN